MSKKEDSKKEKTIEELELKVSELENNWKRALADYRNLQNRVEEAKEEYIRFAHSNIILRLLPILDNLELTEKHIDDAGISMIVREFKQVLDEEGIKEIDAINADFDASTMDAIETVEGDPGKVVEVVKKGYLYKDKVLRPAGVKVGQVIGG